MSGDIDAADQREPAQDLALAGAGQRILEVGRGMHRLDHDLARREVVERDLLDAAAIAGIVVVDAECLEAVRDRHGLVVVRRSGCVVPMMPANVAAFHCGSGHGAMRRIPDRGECLRCAAESLVAMATAQQDMRVVASAATEPGHNVAMSDTPADLLTVAISSRALFDLEDSHSLFEAQGIDAYRRAPAQPRGRRAGAGHRVPAGAQAAGAERGRAAGCAAGRGDPAVAQFLRYRAARVQFDPAPRPRDLARDASPRARRPGPTSSRSARSCSCRRTRNRCAARWRTASPRRPSCRPRRRRTATTSCASPSTATR